MIHISTFPSPYPDDVGRHNKGSIYKQNIYARLESVHSIVQACARAHVTVQYSHGTAMKAMVLGLREKHGYMWSAIDHGLHAHDHRCA
jgi:hypothetical protein